MVPSPASDDRQGFLNACLLEADPAAEQRARRIKRRAILVSIVLQILIVSALLLIPLLGKSENIARRVLIDPSVPYSPGSHPRSAAQPPLRRQTRLDHHFYEPQNIPIVIVTHDRSSSRNEDAAIDNSDIARYGGDGNGPGVPFADSISAPRPPEEPSKPKPIERRKTSELIQSALLIHRVEPIYPALPRQLRREGRVELHAIIAVDGSIQSLGVLSGDPLFITSALDAVRAWRYRPTILNGQALEVDTRITVIYTLSH
jgi:periplasmic protein TonB